jgi:hypothetical protein
VNITFQSGISCGEREVLIYLGICNPGIYIASYERGKVRGIK